ncbi:hypothetical protein GJV82_00290 [Cellulosimicrobium sp. BIT-GX5]|uniref:HTH luxR-type domain-containing protein n=1 Tax=Cellulosimicrobium composti TaxID=2672572 RepID=A0A6N7ZD99_9MICO|nr:LuxR C-terminal-related transcriptional regulator [Cellulosimicrobium composti]MTG87407.1 hypothetical protein [Cellulosimicrobium composti]
MNLNDPVAARAALEQAMASGSPEAIAAAAMTNLWPLYSSHHDLLMRAVERLPSPVLDRYLALRIVHPMTPLLALTHRPFKPLIDPDEARTLSAEEFDFLAVAQMVAFRLSGDVAAAAVCAQRLLERLASVDAEWHQRTDGPLWFAHLQVGSTYLLSGDSRRALLEFARARELGRHSIQPDAERFALSRLALAHALRGSLDDARAALDEAAREPDPSPAHERSVQATEATTEALIAVDRMSDDLELRLARLEPYHSVEMTWPFTLLARARALVSQHRPSEAIEVTELAQESHPRQHGSVANDIVAAVSVEALLAMGDEVTARRLADDRARCGPMTRLASVRVDLHLGRLDAATRDLRRLAGESPLGPRLHAEHVMLSAWLELARNGRVSHHTALAVARAASTGHVRRLIASMPRQLLDAVRERLDDQTGPQLDRSVDGLELRDLPNRSTLTESERRVLYALPLHSTVADLASQFHVSPNTIKSQLKSIYRKLGCSTRNEAIELSALFLTNVTDDRAVRTS